MTSDEILKQLHAARQSRAEVDAIADPVKKALAQLPSRPVALLPDDTEVEARRVELKSTLGSELLGRATRVNSGTVRAALRNAEDRSAKFAADYARDAEVARLGREALQEELAPLVAESARLGTVIDILTIDFLDDLAGAESEIITALQQQMGESFARTMAYLTLRAQWLPRLPPDRRKAGPVAAGALFELPTVPSLRGFAGCRTGIRRVIFDPRLAQPMPGDLVIDGAGIGERIRAEVDAALARVDPSTGAAA